MIHYRFGDVVEGKFAFRYVLMFITDLASDTGNSKWLVLEDEDGSMDRWPTGKVIDGPTGLVTKHARLLTPGPSAT